MSTSRQSPIVVGVDGSGSSLDAVGWAAHAAELRGVPVKLVSAYQVKALYTSFVALPSHIGSEEHKAAESILAWASLVARRSVKDPDGLEISSESIVGPTIQAMLEQSSSASMMVVGSRGNGDYFAELLGSVSTAVAVQAHCPVVIVPKSVELHSSGGPVVLGVDGSPHNQNAVRSAFEEACFAERNWLQCTCRRTNRSRRPTRPRPTDPMRSCRTAEPCWRRACPVGASSIRTSWYSRKCCAATWSRRSSRCHRAPRPWSSVRADATVSATDFSDPRYVHWPTASTAR